MGAESENKDGHIEVECPHCKKKFWHKIGDAFKKVGEGALEIVANVIQPGVPR